MRRKFERISQQVARGENYASHYESRQTFKTFPQETQDIYRRASQSLPYEWCINDFGAVALSEEIKNRMICLALQSHLPHAWYLIPFFQSENGWENFRKKFEGLPEVEKTYPVEKFVKEEVIHTPVENFAILSTLSTGQLFLDAENILFIVRFSELSFLSTFYPQEGCGQNQH